MSGDSQEEDDYGRSPPLTAGSWSSLPPQEKSFNTITPPIGSHEEPCGNTNCFPLLLKHWERLDAGTGRKAQRFSLDPHFSSGDQLNLQVDFSSGRLSRTTEVAERINNTSELPHPASRSSYTSFSASYLHPCPQPLAVLQPSPCNIFPNHLSISRTFLPFLDGQTLPDVYLSPTNELSGSQHSFLSAHESSLEQVIKNSRNCKIKVTNLKSHRNYIIQDRVAPLNSSVSINNELSSEIKDHKYQEHMLRNLKSHRNHLLQDRFARHDNSVSNNEGFSSEIKDSMNQKNKSRNFKSHRNQLLQDRFVHCNSSVSSNEGSSGKIKDSMNQKNKSRNFKSQRNRLLADRFLPYKTSLSRSNEESSSEIKEYRNQKHRTRNLKSHRNYLLQDRFARFNTTNSRSNKYSSSEITDYRNQKYKTKTSKSHYNQDLHDRFAPYNYSISRSNKSSTEGSRTSCITSTSNKTKSSSPKIKLGETLNKIPLPNSEFKNANISKVADIYKPKACPIYIPDFPKLLIPDMPKITIPKLKDILNDLGVDTQPMPKNVAFDFNELPIMKLRSKSASEISVSPTSCERNVLEASNASWETYSEQSEAPDVTRYQDCYL